MKFVHWFGNVWICLVLSFFTHLLCIWAYGLTGNVLLFHLGHLTGLFVPNFLGFEMNLFGGSQASHLWLACFVGIGPLALVHLLSRHFELNPKIRIPLNFATLFVIALMVDMLVWHEWRSWQLLYWNLQLRTTLLGKSSESPTRSEARRQSETSERVS
jgi:hypothetical protein